MPPLHGILETSLYVKDLDTSENFYRGLFGWPLLISDERMRALKIADTQILLLFKVGASIRGEETAGGFIPPHDGHGTLHLAFAIDLNDVEAWRKYLQERGVAIESEVRANQGYSLYFRDPDAHLIELGAAGLWKIEH